MASAMNRSMKSQTDLNKARKILHRNIENSAIHVTSVRRCALSSGVAALEDWNKAIRLTTTGPELFDTTCSNRKIYGRAGLTSPRVVFVRLVHRGERSYWLSERFSQPGRLT